MLFLLGLAFGSFLNVCISRIPRDESIVAPPSHCRSCGAAIRWYDNIPLASWIFLRGRCRRCGAHISFRYPAVELLTAILFVVCYAAFGPTWLLLKACIFSFLILGLIFMDAETGLLPHEFIYTGVVLGLAFSWAPVDTGGARFLLKLYGVHVPHWVGLLDSLLGALVGAGFFYLAWALYYLVRKRHGLGFGDIALMAMVGAFLGLKLTLLVIFLSPLTGVLYAAVLLVMEGFRSAPANSQQKAGEAEPMLSREIPFGVFLGICSLVAMFFGQQVWQWYLHMLG